MMNEWDGQLIRSKGGDLCRRELSSESSQQYTPHGALSFIHLIHLERDQGPLGLITERARTNPTDDSRVVIREVHRRDNRRSGR